MKKKNEKKTYVKKRKMMGKRNENVKGRRKNIFEVKINETKEEYERHCRRVGNKREEKGIKGEVIDREEKDRRN